MRRTPLLTTLLWTSVGGIVAAACGDDPAPIVDARLVDSMADAFVGPLAQFPATLASVSECGVAMPPTVDLPVQNVGTSPLTISGATASGGFAVTTAFPVEIAPGASASIAVRPPAAVIGTDVGGASKIGTLALQTNQPGTIGTVTLTSSVRGADLAFTDGASAPLAQIDLSSSTGACPTAASVFVRNTGNASVTVAASSADGFSVGAFSPSASVAGGGAISHELGALTSGACTGSGTIQYTVTGSVCTALPASLPANLDIAGASTCFCGPVAQVPAALTSISACGVATPPAVDLPVENVGTSPLTISGATASGGFAVTTPLPIVVAPGATATIGVRPPAAVVGTDVGGASKTGILSLQTNQPGATGTVMLTSNVHGANLAFTDAGGAPLALIDLSSSTGACPAPVSVFVRNTGNADATVVPSSSASDFSVGAFSPSGTVAGGGVISHDVGATTAGACVASAAIQYTVTGTVCTTVPIALQANLDIAGSSSCFCS